MTTMLVAQGHSHIRIVWHNYLFLHDRYERKSKSLFLLGFDFRYLTILNLKNYSGELLLGSGKDWKC